MNHINKDVITTAIAKTEIAFCDNAKLYIERLNKETGLNVQFNDLVEYAKFYPDLYDYFPELSGYRVVVMGGRHGCRSKTIYVPDSMPAVLTALYELGIRTSLDHVKLITTRLQAKQRVLISSSRSNVTIQNVTIQKIQ